MATREFELHKSDFEWVCDTMRGVTGIQLSDSKFDLVYNRLSRRLRTLGLHDFESYRSRVEQGDDVEMVELVNALTTNVTSFFREKHHFEHLTEHVVPTFLEAHGGLEGMRVWSAGCSTGQEPYSIAMTLAQALPERTLDKTKILATDLDTKVLARASEGVYPSDQVDGLPEQTLQFGFLRGRGEMAGKVRVKPGLQRLITFRQLNLMDEPWPFKRQFDVIFCRNVVIYFDAPTQDRLFRRYARQLVPGGLLCIGHSESATSCTDVLQAQGRSMYRRIS